MAKKDLDKLVGGFIGEQTERAKARELTPEEIVEKREIIHSKQVAHRGRPKKEQTKLESGYIRSSLILNSKKYGKVKEIALREGLTYTEVFEACLDMAIERYESKYGVITPREPKALKEIFG